MYNRKSFFDALRSSLNLVRLSQVQVDTLNAILEIGEQGWKGKPITIPQLAYVIATAYHESVFNPVKEIRARANTSLRRTQDRYWSSGFFGRGLIQITWRENYAEMGKRIGMDLVGNPDLALDPEIAVKILFSWFFDGAISGQGKITKYISGNKKQYISARLLVNNDVEKNAATIADHAKNIERILTYCLEAEPIAVPNLPNRQFLPMISDIPEEVETPEFQEEVVPQKPKLNKPKAFTIVGFVIWFCTDVLGIPLDYVTTALNYLLPYAQSKPLRWAVIGVGGVVLYLYWKGYLMNIKNRFTSAIEGFKNAR